MSAGSRDVVAQVLDLRRRADDIAADFINPRDIGKNLVARSFAIDGELFYLLGRAEHIGGSMSGHESCRRQFEVILAGPAAFVAVKDAIGFDPSGYERHDRCVQQLRNDKPTLGDIAEVQVFILEHAIAHIVDGLGSFEVIVVGRMVHSGHTFIERCVVMRSSASVGPKCE